MLLKLFILTSAFVAVSPYRLQNELEGAKAYTVSPLTKTQQGLVHNLQDTLRGVDIVQYAHVGGREARIVVSKETQATFESTLSLFRIPFEIYMDDVKVTAEKEMLRNEMARTMFRARANSTIGFTAYHRYDEINAYLDDLQERFPDKVTVRNVGLSPEGRTIKLIIISTTGGADSSKPVFLADAGIHAREWIAPAQALYMIKKLVEDITESDLVEKMDWVIFPLLNPDGYEFSHTTTRMWRKTRTTIASTDCPGVDGNRNFEFQWMGSGASSNPCSNTYAGLAAFSEPETIFFRDVTQEFQERAKIAVAIHSHGSYFLYPFSYNAGPTPDNHELHEVGLKVGEAIDAAAESGSRRYLVGNAAQLLNYLASGVSSDWTYAVGNIKLSYTLELPGGGSQGFDLPPERIQQVVKETWEGMIVLARYAIQENL